MQVPLAGMMPFDRPTVPAPALAVNVPPQDLLDDAGDDTSIPGGKLSVKLASRAGTTAELLRTKVMVELVPAGMTEGENALLIDGLAETVKEALAVLPDPPLVELTVPETLL